MQTIPAKPMASPIQPMGLIDSMNNARAIRATNRGWQSIRTEPRPAPVPSNPRANRP